MQLTVYRPDMGGQRVRGVDASEGKRGARHGRPGLVVGTGVGVGAGRRRGLVRGGVSRDRDRFVRGVQVRHGGERARALPVARHLDARDCTQQTEPRPARHDLRARARREGPRAGALPPVRRARLCAHVVTQNSHLSQCKQGSRVRATPGHYDERRHRTLRGNINDFGIKLHFNNKHKVRREIVNSFHVPCKILTDLL